MRNVVFVIVGLVALLAGTTSVDGKRSRGRCQGFYSDGALRRGVALEDEGKHHYLLYPRECYDREPMVEAYPDEGRRGNAYAHPTVVRSVKRVARAIRREHRDAPRLPVGELSNPTGGKIPYHRSHQNGLDVDIFFLVRPRADTPEGGPWTDPERIVPQCQDGPGLEVQDPKTGRWRVHGAFARDWNWTMVAEFARQDEVKVIFIGALLKKELARWSRRARVPKEERERTLDKLKAVVCRRGHREARRGYRGNYCPHEDHIHVRYFCPEDSPSCREQ